MGEIVNLRRVKKARARAEAVLQAAANRAKHGVGKDERTATETRREHVERQLDGARLDGSGPRRDSEAGE